MALKHYESGEIFDVRPLGASLRETSTRTLIKTESFELIRIVMHAGKEIPEHKAPGEIIVQCLEGKITFHAQGDSIHLGEEQSIYLSAGEPHSVSCQEDASFLLTVLLGK